MMSGRTIRATALILVTATTVLLAACHPPIAPRGTGSLSISLETEGTSQRTAVPVLDMTISTYKISGSGPGGASFVESGHTSTSLVKDMLVTGSWTITVDGLNPAEAVIATCSAATEIYGGQTAAITMKLVPVSGDGTFSGTVSWPAASLDNPSLVATLTPYGGAPRPISFTVSGSSASYTGRWADGYYMINLVLSDGETQVWGKSDAVRILADQTTAATYAYAPPLPTVFKIANSWGAGWGAAGFYWFTASAMINAQVPAYFYVDRVAYNPTYVVVFSMTHPSRNDPMVRVGLGDPYNPVISKTFEPSYFGDAGGNAFPSGKIALDISEFAPYIDSNELYLAVYDRGDNPATGTVTSFSVERFDSYGSTPSTTIGSYSPLPQTTVNGGTIFAYVHTSGAIGAPPVAASVQSTIDQLFTTRPLTEAEFEKLKQTLGVYQPGTNYNHTIAGHGTGFTPPTAGQWDQIQASARTIDSPRSEVVASSPGRVDLSQDPAFPPIGNQGAEGACTAFSTTYYIQTFLEAKEHGWDISDSGWGGPGTGHPLTNLDKIMSPAFTYNLCNWGSDNGSSFYGNANILTTIGCASWETMPYIPGDYTSWPNETAWREAPLYRASWPDSAHWGTQFLFSIDSDQKVQILKALLDHGIPVSITVASGQFAKFAPGAIWDTDNYLPPYALDHENTIVGYQQ